MQCIERISIEQICQYQCEMRIVYTISRSSHNLHRWCYHSKESMHAKKKVKLDYAKSFDSIERARINWHSQCLRVRYGEQVWRLGIDAGFTCPHRSVDRLHGGCRFCASDGNVSAYQKSQAFKSKTSVPNTINAKRQCKQSYR